MELLKLLLYMLILNYAKSFHDFDLTEEHRLPIYLIPDHYDIKLEQPKQQSQSTSMAYALPTSDFFIQSLLYVCMHKNHMYD